MKICIIPLKINLLEKKTTVTFKYRSKQTLIFLIYQFILTVILGFMMIYMTGINHIITWFVTKFQNSNFIDFISLFIIMIFGAFIPSFSLPFAKQLTYVANGIILSPILQ